MQMQLRTHGTVYGGWKLPAGLNENSIVYSAGVGEDMSFDLEVNSLYKSKIILFDPTERAIKHYDEVVRFYQDKSSFEFTGNIQKDYLQRIANLKPNFNDFKFIKTGLWNKKDTLKFYKQENPSYVSQTIIPGMYGEEYTTVNVDTIKNFMREFGHTHIDVLKLDIEGAEIEVLNHLLDSAIFPKYLCIEFDLYIKGRDNRGLTEKVIKRLLGFGYTILSNDNMNIVFGLDTNTRFS
jgi:FkbM family methyltransferase